MGHGSEPKTSNFWGRNNRNVAFERNDHNEEFEKIWIPSSLE